VRGFLAELISLRHSGSCAVVGVHCAVFLSQGNVYVMMNKVVLEPSDVLKWIQQYVDGELSPTS
jgi:hypothetical protein